MRQRNVTHGDRSDGPRHRRGSSVAGGGPGRQRADRESQEGASKARKPKAQIIALGAAAALVAAAAGTYALTHSGAGQSAVSTAAHVQVGHAAAPKAQS